MPWWLLPPQRSVRPIRFSCGIIEEALIFSLVKVQRILFLSLVVKREKEQKVSLHSFRRGCKGVPWPRILRGG